MKLGFAPGKRSRKVFKIEEWTIVVTPRDYNRERWWASSEGIKDTLTEGLGWAYELIFDSGR